MVVVGVRRLAVAVIEQAWLDFLYGARPHSEEAKRWFLGADFETWAEPLGYDVEQWRGKVAETTPDWRREQEIDAATRPERFKRAHWARGKKP